MAQDNYKKMEYRYYWDSRKDRKKVLATEYDLMLRCQTRGSLLMICVFLPEMLETGVLDPVYEIYCNPEGNEYITRVMEKGQETGWSTAMFGNLKYISDKRWASYGMIGADRRIWQNPEGRDTIRKILKTKEKGFRGLMEWQQKARDKKTEEAEARQQAPWDADMKMVPDIMPSFGDWMAKEAADDYFIIYQYSGKGADEGWCTGCRKFVPVAKPRHNKRGRCTGCGREITFKSEGKIRRLSTGWYRAQCIQRIRSGNGIVVREFEQRQSYGEDYRKPSVYLRETDRILIFDSGETRRYYYGLYKNKTNRFIRDTVVDRYCIRNIKLYTRNLHSLKNTSLKNSAVDLWMTRWKKKRLPVDTVRYLMTEKGNPAVEKLAKIGMFRLAEELILAEYATNKGLLNEEATELARLLKIDNAKLKRLKAMDGGIDHLRWFQHEKIINHIFPDGMIKDFADNGITTSDMAFLPLPLKYVKIWNYMQKQRKLCGDSMAQIRQLWRDYLNMAEKAKMDTGNEQIWKPKDLKKAHNEVMLLLQKGEMEKEASELEKKWKKVNSQLPKLQKYEFSDGQFSIIAPKEIIDIVKEGRILQHCVHTCDFYFDRIERDESYLFFLRRADHEDVPWYTLEVEPNGNIRQKRTTGDNQNKDFEEAVKFLKKWQKEFVKRMSREEKELGVKADRARIEGYEQLRKNGNRIWHGRLAGQLLADVLENDFMAAVF